jgi:hypothetical protein
MKNIQLNQFEKMKHDFMQLVVLSMRITTSQKLLHINENLKRMDRF